MHWLLSFLFELDSHMSDGTMDVGTENTLGAPNFCLKNLSLHLNFARKNFQHIIYDNRIKTNFRLQ